MNTFKQLVAYLIWTVLALLLGIGNMWVLLGSNKKSSSEFLNTFGDLFYEFALVHIGLRVGVIIGLLFIITDVFYLRKKLGNNIKPTISRFLFLIGIAIVVGAIHYTLEKIINVI